MGLVSHMSSPERESKTSPRAGDSIPRPRIQTLSDMIFGLALSIGAVAQLSRNPTGLGDILNSLGSFGFAFLILAVIWLRYSRIMSVLPVESPRIIAANMLLLFLVSVEPYLYNLMTISGYTPGPNELASGTTTSLYALDVGALMIVIAYFTHEVTVEERHLIPRELMRGYRITMYTTLAAAAVFIISVLPIFWSIVVIQSPTIPLRYIMWCTVLMLNWWRRVNAWTTSRKSKPP